MREDDRHEKSPDRSRGGATDHHENLDATRNRLPTEGPASLFAPRLEACIDQLDDPDRQNGCGDAEEVAENRDPLLPVSLGQVERENCCQTGQNSEQQIGGPPPPAQPGAVVTLSQVPNGHEWHEETRHRNQPPPNHARPEGIVHHRCAVGMRAMLPNQPGDPRQDADSDHRESDSREPAEDEWGQLRPAGLGPTITVKEDAHRGADQDRQDADRCREGDCYEAARPGGRGRWSPVDGPLSRGRGRSLGPRVFQRQTLWCLFMARRLGPFWLYSAGGLFRVRGQGHCGELNHD